MKSILHVGRGYMVSDLQSCGVENLSHCVIKLW